MSQTSTPRKGSSGKSGTTASSEKEKSASSNTPSNSGTSNVAPRKLVSPRDAEATNTSEAKREELPSAATSTPVPQGSSSTSSVPVANNNATQDGLDIDFEFSKISEQVGSLDSIIDPRDPASLQTAMEKISLVIGNLEKLKRLISQDTNSRGSVAREKMEDDIDELLEHTAILKSHLQKALSVSASAATAASAVNTAAAATTNAADQSDDDVNPFQELSREELGKLLLLVAKAFELKQIDRQQRRVIKSHICRRAGYLRIILQQEDISVIMRALCAIGSDSS